MSGIEKTELLCRWAREEGFDRAAVAALRPLPRGGRYVDWLARGMASGMSYLARRAEARLDPTRVFPGASSVVCVALDYARDEEGGDVAVGDLWPGVARYARGRDYHEVMGERLARLGKRIEEGFAGVRTRWYVDTGPVLERELAAMCGLGTIGKNTCLLHPEVGSWFFIGEVFTSLRLESSPAQVADLCGSCSLCLEACPTGALPEPFQLDSRRCISYWTIEHRGDIPPDVRPVLGHWVFGCDICQEVCPHNAGTAPVVDEQFELAGERSGLDLVALLRLEQEDYAKVFRGSAMKRAKRAGLQRNACVAMGNSGDQKYVEALAQAVLASDSVTVRRHAAWALAAIGGKEATAVLTVAVSREADEDVRREILDGLEMLVGKS